MVRFTFTITHVGIFLGKSPVTLRGWERNKLVVMPRDPSGDRKFTTTDVRILSFQALQYGRISVWRHQVVLAVMTMLELIEKENNE